MKRESSEYIANRVFMAVSGALVVLSFVLFFWLAGTLEFRGSNGELSAHVTLRCQHANMKDVKGDVFVNLEEGMISFVVWSEKGDVIKTSCPKTEIHSLPRPNSVISLGTPDAPGDDKELDTQFAPFKNPGGALLSYQAGVDTQARLGLKFDPDKLQQFIGLSERSTSVDVKLAAAPEGSYLETLAYDLTIRPPVNFYLASSRPPAAAAGDIDWKVDAQAYKVEADFKNDHLARLDHIIDSSIAAVLGVGVAGIMSAWLAIRILETKGSDK
ncbi:MAG TPA: hypothetical protein VM782_03910 [Stellaceae bacterium]|nr:hypothetical protein [Stellaceae bacterium]